jgi:hypothetical protein
MSGGFNYSKWDHLDEYDSLDSADEAPASTVPNVTRFNEAQSVTFGGGQPWSQHTKKESKSSSSSPSSSSSSSSSLSVAVSAPVSSAPQSANCAQPEQQESEKAVTDTPETRALDRQEFTLNGQLEDEPGVTKWPLLWSQSKLELAVAFELPLDRAAGFKASQLKAELSKQHFKLTVEDEVVFDQELLYAIDTRELQSTEDANWMWELVTGARSGAKFVVFSFRKAPLPTGISAVWWRCFAKNSSSKVDVTSLKGRSQSKIKEMQKMDKDWALSHANVKLESEIHADDGQE